MIDLHVHTTASDGLLSPSKILHFSRECGVKVLSVCDHDTVDALPVLISESAKSGIQFIPGVELTCHSQTGILHLLGYRINHRDTTLVEKLDFYQNQRRVRIKNILEKLRRNGVCLDSEKITSEAGTSPGKPHIARALVTSGYASSINDAFARFLGSGKVADVPKEKFDIRDAISVVRHSGGVPVLAHPSTVNIAPGLFREYVSPLIEYGLGGIEVYASLHSDEEVSFYLSVAKELSLIVTGGSDYHGDSAEQQLGLYGRGRQIPEMCCNDLLNQ